jgi:hypothetical protein
MFSALMKVLLRPAMVPLLFKSPVRLRLMSRPAIKLPSPLRSPSLTRR